MLTTADINAFISLVNEAQSPSLRDTVQPDTRSETDVLEPRVPGAIEKGTFDKVHSLICVPKGRSFSDIRSLLGTLVSRTVLDPSLSVCRDTVRILQYGTDAGKMFKDFSDRNAWTAAIRELNDPAFRRTSHFNPNSLAGFEREISVGNAVKRLQEAGYRFRFDGHRISFDDNELDRCCRALASRINKVTGQRVLEVVFQRLASSVPFLKGRYLVSRPSRSPGAMNGDPSVPYGYLINLAMGNLSSSPKPAKKAPTKVNEIIAFATDVVAACDIETFSPYGHFFQSHESLPEYLQNIVLGDQLLTFRQVAPQDASTIIEGVYRWVNRGQMKTSLGWNIDDGLLLAKALWRLAAAGGPGVMIEEAMLTKIGINPTTLRAMLGTFVHAQGAVNKGYLTPADAIKATSFLKPLVRLGPKRLFMISPPISSMAFYEAIATALRTWLKKQSGAPDVDAEIGLHIESTLGNAFTNHGIKPTAVSKKYGTLECDLVIESARTIFLIETKKKSLTRQAQAGNTLSAFVDLMGGAMDSQLQLGRHELNLRQHGHIVFKDGTKLDLNGRSIAKIATTLLDWGGTQDRIVLKQVAQLLTNSTLSSPSTDTQYKEALIKANATLRKLQDQHNKLVSVGVDPKALFANWWFLSVPQLLFTLDGVSSIEGFENRLKSVSAITFGQLDYYTELSNVERWKAKASR